MIPASFEMVSVSRVCFVAVLSGRYDARDGDRHDDRDDRDHDHELDQSEASAAVHAPLFFLVPPIE